jgi:L-threonylcarbamoyladenylate synthase
VAGIFRAKGRPSTDPLIVHVTGIDEVPLVCVEVPPLARELAAKFWPGPLTLILRRGPAIPPSVSAGLDTVAVRAPDHPVAQALLQAVGAPIAAPSANLFARPSPTTAAHVLADLAGRVDLILDGGPTPIGVESTVLDLTAEVPTVLRPGGVPIEALEAVLPAVAFRPRHLPLDAEAAGSPGMLLKHYSPRAEMWLFAGADGVGEKMLTAAGRALREGRRVGALAYADEATRWRELGAEVFELGAASEPEQAARLLFAGLRELDGRGVDVIVASGPARGGLGEAVWDRLFRAAEGRLAG